MRSRTYKRKVKYWDIDEPGIRKRANEVRDQLLDEMTCAAMDAFDRGVARGREEGGAADGARAALKEVDRIIRQWREQWAKGVPADQLERDLPFRSLKSTEAAFVRAADLLLGMLEANCPPPRKPRVRRGDRP